MKLAEKNLNCDVVTTKHYLIPQRALELGWPPVLSHLSGRGPLSCHIHTITRLGYELPPGRGHDFGPGHSLLLRTIPSEGLSWEP